MNIKNYTSETPASTSLAKIEKNLVAAGARNIMKKYDSDGQCEAISFSLPINGNTVAFQLPANINSVYKLLVSSYTRPTDRSFQLCREQAERTAWKLISDWVEIQASMIRLEQAEIMQIFLPYVYDIHTDSTFYSRLKESNFKLLAAPK